jgi:AraC-like DNA-binding protein
MGYNCLYSSLLPYFIPMDIISAVGPLVAPDDYNQNTLKNLRTLFRRYQLVNAVSIEVDQLLISQECVDIVTLRDLQRESIEVMLSEGYSYAGFALGQLFSVESFGRFNIALQSAPNLASAVRLISAYAPQFEAILQIRLCEESGRLYIEFGDEQPVSAWQFEDALVACWQLLVQLTQTQLAATRVCLQAPEQEYSQQLNEMFSSNVEFSSSSTYIQLSLLDWARPMGAPSPLITTLFECWAYQEGDDESRFLAEIYHTIYEQLSQRIIEFALPDLAKKHYCSVATMKRRLAKHDKTITKMKDEVHMLVCYHYVTMTALPLTSVADWLGFSDGSNFCRACKRWFGVTPSNLRRLSRY